MDVSKYTMLRNLFTHFSRISLSLFYKAQIMTNCYVQITLWNQASKTNLKFHESKQLKIRTFQSIKINKGFLHDHHDNFKKSSKPTVKGAKIHCYPKNTSLHCKTRLVKSVSRIWTKSAFFLESFIVYIFTITWENIQNWLTKHAEISYHPKNILFHCRIRFRNTVIENFP